MRDDIRLAAIAVGMASLALFLIPYVAVQLIVLIAIAAGLIIAMLIR